MSTGPRPWKQYRTSLPTLYRTLDCGDQKVRHPRLVLEIHGEKTRLIKSETGTDTCPEALPGKIRERGYSLADLEKPGAIEFPGEEAEQEI